MSFHELALGRKGLNHSDCNGESNWSFALNHGSVIHLRYTGCTSYGLPRFALQVPRFDLQVPQPVPVHGLANDGPLQRDTAGQWAVVERSNP